MFRLEKKFLSRDPPPPVKGKIFDTRFGLIHVQTGEKIFVKGPLPPPQVKGKIFDTRFGLIHVQTGKKNFCRGTPLPSVKGKIFDTRFGLIHVQTGKKNFCRGTPPPNSKDLLWLRGGRYASCVYAGGLSFLSFFLMNETEKKNQNKTVQVYSIWNKLHWASNIAPYVIVQTHVWVSFLF